ncbi:peptidyl-tRNA hydrolase 2, mitochondrial-like isoform X2 [Chenopodium quinoa]|uniref:peptidyl-tRNA hydrolase 2, mitochondrial-like isoform X2 n=1 Tax=Chenopodium quinoa TaxID=63459 RepID=UPI000B788219|nr:peptidyl-tRNA hydrolase 2, mitochondrial-like isoform X2 [Chenopodium quinoa]
MNFSIPLGKQPDREEKEGVGVSFRPENFIPGVVIGFIFGFLLDLAKPSKNPPKSFHQTKNSLTSANPDEEFKMVLVVRQDLKMGHGKIAAQCAHAATGMYADLMQSQRSLLRQWEQCGQAKIVVTCKNQKEMNKLQQDAENIGLPTFVVADAGRTQDEKIPWILSRGNKDFFDSLACQKLYCLGFNQEAVPFLQINKESIRVLSRV